MDQQQHDAAAATECDVQSEGEEHDDDDDSVTKIMESLEEQRMNDEMEAERVKMELERGIRKVGSSRYKSEISATGSKGRRAASFGLRYNFGDSNSARSAGKDKPLKRSASTVGQEKEADTDVTRRLSLPFGSLRHDDARILRKSSIYPSVKSFRRRQSLVDSVPALIPYAASRKEMDGSVYTATTCAETNTLSDSASSMYGLSTRRSGSQASLMLDNSAYSSSGGDLNWTNHSSSTIGTNRDSYSIRGGYEATDGASLSSSIRSHGHSSHQSRRAFPSVKSEGGRYGHDYHHHHQSEKDFTRERYYPRSQIMDHDMPLYGSSRSSRRLDDEEEDEKVGPVAPRNHPMKDVFLTDESLRLEDLQQQQPGPLLQGRGRPGPSLSPCQERPQRSVPKLSPCHERSARSERSSPGSFLNRLPRRVADRNRVHYGDSLDESGHVVSDTSSSSDDGMALTAPCERRTSLEWSSGGSPRSRNTYPLDAAAERRYRFHQTREREGHKSFSTLLQEDPIEHQRRTRGQQQPRRSSCSALPGGESFAYRPQLHQERHDHGDSTTQETDPFAYHSQPPQQSRNSGNAHVPQIDPCTYGIRPQQQERRNSMGALRGSDAFVYHNQAPQRRRSSVGALSQPTEPFVYRIQPPQQRRNSAGGVLLQTQPFANRVGAPTGRPFELVPQQMHPQSRRRSMGRREDPYTEDDHGEPAFPPADPRRYDRSSVLPASLATPSRDSPTLYYDKSRNDSSRSLPLDYDRDQSSRRNRTTSFPEYTRHRNNSRRIPEESLYPADGESAGSKHVAEDSEQTSNPSERMQSLPLAQGEEPAVEPVEGYIEIGPGVKATMRSSKDTKAAIVNDFYVPKVCFGCSLDQFCIKDVLYFVCPVCKVVNPMDDDSSDLSKDQRTQSTAATAHGVCEGFTFETLFAMQAEIMKEG